MRVGNISQKLGILVCSEKNPEYTIKLVQAALDKGKTVIVYLVGRGVYQFWRPEFKALCHRIQVFICETSCRTLGLYERGKDGLSAAEYLTLPAKHSELLQEVDRYVVL